MLVGVAKTVPVAAVLAGLALQNIAVYAVAVTTLAGVLVVGALWAAAKAWRERAEARSDEAVDLRAQLKRATQRIDDQDKSIASLEATIEELRRRTDVEAVGAHLAEQIAAGRKDHERLTREHHEIVAALGGVKTALEFIAKQTFPTELDAPDGTPPLPSAP